MRSIFLILSLVVLSQATHKIPLKVYQRKINLDAKLGDSDDDKPLSFKDSALAVQVTVGNHSYTVALDSLSDRLWLPSTECDTPFCDRTANKIKVSSKDNPSLGYHGLVQGHDVKVSLDMGDDFVIDNVNLLAADYVDADVAKRLPLGVNGVLGLMDTSVFNSDLMGPDMIVSLYINKHSDESGLYLATIPYHLTKRNPDSFEPTYLASDSKTIFKTSLNYIKVSDGPWTFWSKGGADVVLDTTYSGIAGPIHEVESLNKYLGTDDDGYIDCDRVQFLRPLAFRIKGNSYNLNPKNYIRRSYKNFDTRCKSVFEAHASTQNIWKLGVAFMHQYLTVFTNNGNKMLVSFIELK